MKILLELEILPKPGWRKLNATEEEIHGAMFLTDAPDDHLLLLDDEEYSIVLYEKSIISQDLGRWIRDTYNDCADPITKIGRVRQYNVREI